MAKIKLHQSLRLKKSLKINNLPLVEELSDEQLTSICGGMTSTEGLTVDINIDNTDGGRPPNPPAPIISDPPEISPTVFLTQ